MKCVTIDTDPGHDHIPIHRGADRPLVREPNFAALVPVEECARNDIVSRMTPLRVPLKP